MLLTLTGTERVRGRYGEEQKIYLNLITSGNLGEVLKMIVMYFKYKKRLRLSSPVIFLMLIILIYF